MTAKLFTSLVSTIIFMAASQAQKVADYLQTPGPLLFGGKSYALSWSAHPSPAYYKQEYLEAGEPAARYKKMILLEVVTGVTDLKSLVNAKAEELRNMKANNPIVNYQVFDNSSKGEYIIDFLLSANDANGKLSVLERNVYRYKLYSDSKNNKGILLFAVSERSYGTDADAFLKNLKSTKQELLNLVAKYAIPNAAIR